MNWVNAENGITIADTSEILEDVQNAFTSAFPSLNLDPSTPQGQIITYLTELLTQANGAVAAFGNAMTSGGSGIWLDARNKTLYGITRKPASPGSVTAIISGVIGTIIPSGFTATAEGYNFATREQYVIGSAGIIAAELFALSEDSFSVPAGSLTEIVTAVAGVERITNPQPSIPGQTAETDAAFRARAAKSVFYNSAALYAGLLAQLLQLDGVEAVGGYENTGSESVTWKGTIMQPHSINTIVKGGDVNAIGEAILKTKNPGCYVGGNIEVPVTEPISGQTYIMRFYRPEPAPLAAEVTVKLGDNVSQDYAETIRTQLEAYISALDFGAEIYPFQAVSVIDVPDLEVVDFKLGRQNSEAGYGILALNFLEEAELASAAVKIYATD